MNDSNLSGILRQRGVHLTELAHLRQGCYRLFGAAFLYPDEERLRNLLAAALELRELQASAPFLEPWQRMLAALQKSANGKTARVEGEYVRLFLVRPVAPPFESFYVDPERQAAGWIAARLSQEYSNWGLVSSPSLREPPDHVAVELEFMAFLCGLEAQAWKDESSAEGFGTVRSQRDFLEKHLERWFPAFAQEVAVPDTVGLYAVIAETADAFIRHDRDVIDLLLARFQAAEDDS